MEYTVIHGNNQVSQYNSSHDVARDIKDNFLLVNQSGGVVRVGQNPIDWPTDATIGLMAIVDVKTGSLRFCHDELIGLYEYVVSTYGGRGTVKKPKPTGAVENIDVLDMVTVWPKAKESPVNINIDGLEWNWVFDGKGWCICNHSTIYDEDGWKDYIKDKEDKNRALTSIEDAQSSVTAASMLEAALGHMEDRAKTYDAPGGERSMGKTVSAFNTITGLTLSEEQGWLFMEILKQVRSQQGNYRADNYEDMVAYAALRGECAARERKD